MATRRRPKTHAGKLVRLGGHTYQLRLVKKATLKDLGAVKRRRKAKKR